MKNGIQIRMYRLGDEEALYKVHYSAIHKIASRDYSEEQIQAWAPREVDADLWGKRIGKINPFVAEFQGEIVGYADLQDDGYIDHFFVSGEHRRRGIGAMLMNHILETAAKGKMSKLTSDVSLTAQPFYERFGFVVVEQRQPERRGVIIPNALMSKQL